MIFWRSTARTAERNDIALKGRSHRLLDFMFHSINKIHFLLYKALLIVLIFLKSQFLSVLKIYFEKSFHASMKKFM